MHILFALLLQALHLVYKLVLKARSFREKCSSRKPEPLLAARGRIPKHLAILFVAPSAQDTEATKAVLTESILDAVKWCRSIGIAKLTVYEEHDLLSQCAQHIRDSLPIYAQELDSSESEIDYPLTPPPSDYSESRPLSPNQNGEGIVPVTVIYVAEPAPYPEMLEPSKSIRRRQPQRNNAKTSVPDLQLCLISRKSSKGAIAMAAQTLAQTHHRTSQNTKSQKHESFKLTVDDLDHLLEDEDGLSSPDFMIVHHIDPPSRHKSPLELHGFPPWHVRLTEIYHSVPHLDSPLRRDGSHEPLCLDETTFRTALDEYATAEMRFGK